MKTQLTEAFRISYGHGCVRWNWEDIGQLRVTDADGFGKGLFKSPILVLTKCTADPKLPTVQTDLGQVCSNVWHVTDKALCICLHYWTAHRANQYRKGLFKCPIFVLTKYSADPKLPTLYGGPCSIILACTFTSPGRVMHTVLVYHLGRTGQNGGSYIMQVFPLSVAFY